MAGYAVIAWVRRVWCPPQLESTWKLLSRQDVIRTRPSGAGKTEVRAVSHPLNRTVLSKERHLTLVRKRA